MATSKQSPDKDVHGELEKLRREVRDLRESYATALGLDAIARGVSEIAELMAPLKTMAPPSRGEPLAKGRAGSLARLQQSLARPDWAAVVALDVQEPSLTFFGGADYPPYEHETVQHKSERSGSK